MLESIQGRALERERVETETLRQIYKELTILNSTALSAINRQAYAQEDMIEL